MSPLTTYIGEPGFQITWENLKFQLDFEKQAIWTVKYIDILKDLKRVEKKDIDFEFTLDGISMNKIIA